MDKGMRPGFKQGLLIFVGLLLVVPAISGAARGDFISALLAGSLALVLFVRAARIDPYEVLPSAMPSISQTSPPPTPSAPPVAPQSSESATSSPQPPEESASTGVPPPPGGVSEPAHAIRDDGSVTDQQTKESWVVGKTVVGLRGSSKRLLVISLACLALGIALWGGYARLQDSQGRLAKAAERQAQAEERVQELEELIVDLQVYVRGIDSDLRTARTSMAEHGERLDQVEDWQEALKTALVLMARR